MAGAEAGAGTTLYCSLNHCFSMSSAPWNPFIVPVCGHIMSKLIGVLHCALILISGGGTRWCRCGWTMEHILSSKNCHVECVCMCMCSWRPLYMLLIVPSKDRLCAWIWMAEVNLRSLVQPLSALIFETRSLTFPYNFNSARLTG